MLPWRFGWATARRGARRALMVSTVPPVFGHAAHYFERDEHVAIKVFRPTGPAQTLNTQHQLSL